MEVWEGEGNGEGGASEVNYRCEQNRKYCK